MFGPPLLRPRISWRQRSVAPLCTAKGLFIHCFLVVCKGGGEGSLGAKGSSSEVLSLPLPAAAGLGGRPESGGVPGRELFHVHPGSSAPVSRASLVEPGLPVLCELTGARLCLTVTKPAS